jgi:hypothetical protein
VDERTDDHHAGGLNADGFSAGGFSAEPADPRDAEGDARASAARMTAASMPSSTTGGVPTPGDSRGVSVPAVQAAAGTSEESGRVEGIRTTANAAPGKPDGEVDTRS